MTLRLLLDQGFPQPRGFDIEQVDRTVVVEHFSTAFPALASVSTPDWMVYCVAARAGFAAVIVRDLSQLSQDVEMYVLSRLNKLTIVTWTKAIEDPLREWAQIVAYLPQLKIWIPRAQGRVIRLPAPLLTDTSLFNPHERLGRQAADRKVSTAQVRREARARIGDWLTEEGFSPTHFDDLLDKRPTKAGRRRELPPS